MELLGEVHGQSGTSWTKDRTILGLVIHICLIAFLKCPITVLLKVWSAHSYGIINILLPVHGKIQEKTNLYHKIN